MDRLALLLIPIGDGLLSLSRRKPKEAIEAPEATSADDTRPLAARMIARVLARVVRDYRLLAGRCEERLRELEDLPVRESQPVFFERTFRLKKELSSAQVDLWRLKGIADDLVQGRNVLAPVLASAETYRRFASDVDYLYETMVNIREGVLSVIDLHLNVVSFEMNRVMRVLAVVSVVGLIPAIVGGLLGMNLIDTPWPLTLAQVAFLVLFGMVLGVYFFFVKGWLR
jgi:Mg2+ and Co2+ transporter CorA